MQAQLSAAQTAVMRGSYEIVELLHGNTLVGAANDRFDRSRWLCAYV